MFPAILIVIQNRQF